MRDREREREREVIDAVPEEIILPVYNIIAMSYFSVKCLVSY